MLLAIPIRQQPTTAVETILYASKIKYASITTEHSAAALAQTNRGVRQIARFFAFQVNHSWK